jgi:hypothetical protein
MTNTKKITLIVLLIGTAIAVSSCIPGTGSFSPVKPAGFFSGVWHGWIAPISLIGGIFNHSIRVYEPINSGWWYDFGFYISIIAGFGGISFFRKKRSE